MRSKGRIKPFLEIIAKEWEKNPNLRFGQFIRNLFKCSHEDFELKFFNTEDDDLLKLIDINLPYTRESIYDLLNSNFNKAIEIINSNVLQSSLLTYVAEDLGEFINDDSFKALKKILTHETSFVREGAIYGLKKFLHNQEYKSDVINIFQTLANYDGSKIIQEIANDELNDALSENF